MYIICNLLYLPYHIVPEVNCEVSWPAAALGSAYSPPADAVSPDTASPSEAQLNPSGKTQQNLSQYL